MATGMVSSASALQNLQAKPVIRAGEKISTSVEAVSNPNAKTYHHSVPGARFIMPDGLEVHFLGGQFVTADLEIIAELDKVANKSTSMIYTQQAAAVAQKAQISQAAADAASSAKVS
jgi:tRNA A58 N-methylase Trm61